MPDMRSRWDEYHRIYPGDLEWGQQVSLTNGLERAKRNPPLTFLLRHRSQALDTLFRRGALSEPSSMKRVSSCSVACHMRSTERKYPRRRECTSALLVIGVSDDWQYFGEINSRRDVAVSRAESQIATHVRVFKQGRDAIGRTRWITQREEAIRASQRDPSSLVSG